MKKTLSLACVLLCLSAVQAAVRLPQLFQDGMVVQRGRPVPVWGWAEPGRMVVVTLNKKTGEAVADSLGRWRVDLPKMKAGGPYTLTVTEAPGNGPAAAASACVVRDVLVGDVWLCSGQSNIDVTIERVYPQYTDEIDDFECSDIRLFRVKTDFDTHAPKTDVLPTGWHTLNKQNAWQFSAVGYFLGKRMHERNRVPQGVIVNSLGGTPIEAWLSADTLKTYFPGDYQRTQFFQDDAMVSALQQANRQAQDRWQRMMDAADPGLGQYAALGYDDSQWPLRAVFTTQPNGRPGSVNLTASASYHGSCWARQYVQVDAAHAGQPARLLVGTLYDADQTYVNGRQVGSTGYQYPPRRYTIPAGLLVEGRNALTVRFVTRGGAPHFIPEKPYKLIFDDGTEVQLSDQWRVRQGVSMPQCPSADAGGQNLPSVLYNAMLSPLAPYGLSGVVWYQGESNTDNPGNYQLLLTKMVENWRQLWQRPELPFVIVQLANFMEPSDQPQESNWAALREAQRLAAKALPHAELAVTIDLGEAVDIHPLRKKEVAERCTQGFEKLLYHGGQLLSPQVLAAETSAENVVVLTTDQPMKPGVLKEFELAGPERKFVAVEAEARGATITLRVPAGVSVGQPAYVRYAWKDNPLKANAYSLQGLPMAPFERKL